VRSPWLRFSIIAVLLIAAGLFSLQNLRSLDVREKPVNLSAAFPLELGEWKGQDGVLTKGTLRLLGTDNVLLRSYRRRGGRGPEVMFCITYSAGNHRITHPPEVCYEGQGWTIGFNEEIDFRFPTAPPVMKKVKHFVIHSKEESQDVLAWFESDAEETSSYLYQKFRMLLGTIFGQDRWCALVRLSAPVEGGDHEAALAAMADLGAELMPHLESLSRNLESP
jgi:EpsI family protein